MVNHGCFNDWETIPANGNDGDFFNYTNESDSKHPSGVYYWNVRLSNPDGELSPEWSYLEVNPSKPYRQDIMDTILGCINVNKDDGKDVYQAIVLTTDKELDRFYKRGLIKIVSYLDKTSVDELPERGEDLIYEANILWSAGLLYNHKTYDYTASSFDKQNRNYVPMGNTLIKEAKEDLYPLSKNKNINDINRSGLLGDIDGLVQ